LVCTQVSSSLDKEKINSADFFKSEPNKISWFSSKAGNRAQLMNERTADPSVRASVVYVVRFGPYELRSETRELCKDGVCIRLQRAPFQLLQALLQRPGEIVTREELHTQLWSSDTLIDFESGLNTAINRLRSALGDSVERPVYVETVTRAGYRFIAPVTALYRDSQPVITVPANEDLSTPKDALKRLFWPVLVGLFALFGLIAAFRLHAVPTAPSFHQLTFLRGFVQEARFTGDGKHVIYSAAWNGKSSRLFKADAASGESQDLGFEHAQLASVSASGRITLFFHRDLGRPADARNMPSLNMLSSKQAGADWGRGNQLALVRKNGDSYTVEYPPGRSLYTSKTYIDDLRISPGGDQIAFLRHPIPNDDGGEVVLVSLGGKSRVLSSGWESVAGLAWHPAGREIWFTAAQFGVERNLMAVDLNGRVRQVAQIPGGMLLRDINSAGDVLIARATSRMTMQAGTFGGKTEDISWLDWSRAVAISSGGNQVLFDESGQGGGSRYSVYLYDANKRFSELLGEGRAVDLSPDGRWALTQDARDLKTLSLISINDRLVKPIAAEGLEIAWAKFFPCEGSLEILMAANDPGKPLQLYRQHLPDGKPVLIDTSMQLSTAIIDGTGHLAVGPAGNSAIAVVDLTNGSARSLDNPKHVWPIAFASNGQILTSRRDGDSLVLEFLDLATGRLRPFQRVDTADPVGVADISPIFVSKDLHTFVYSHLQTLSTLYWVSGWN
jgi:DNA-binding winged helix-turn-helix (wHTH) protein